MTSSNNEIQKVASTLAERAVLVRAIPPTSTKKQALASPRVNWLTCLGMAKAAIEGPIPSAPPAPPTPSAPTKSPDQFANALSGYDPLRSGLYGAGIGGLVGGVGGWLTGDEEEDDGGSRFLRGALAGAGIGGGLGVGLPSLGKYMQRRDARKWYDENAPTNLGVGDTIEAAAGSPLMAAGAAGAAYGPISRQMQAKKPAEIWNMAERGDRGAQRFVKSVLGKGEISWDVSDRAAMRGATSPEMQKAFLDKVNAEFKGGKTPGDFSRHADNSGGKVFHRTRAPKPTILNKRLHPGFEQGGSYGSKARGLGRSALYGGIPLAASYGLEALQSWMAKDRAKHRQVGIDYGFEGE
jgi:hypothetical protein